MLSPILSSFVTHVTIQSVNVTTSTAIQSGYCNLFPINNKIIATKAMTKLLASLKALIQATGVLSKSFPLNFTNAGKVSTYVIIPQTNKMPDIINNWYNILNDLTFIWLFTFDFFFHKNIPSICVGTYHPEYKRPFNRFPSLNDIIDASPQATTPQKKFVQFFLAINNQQTVLVYAEITFIIGHKYQNLSLVVFQIVIHKIKITEDPMKLRMIKANSTLLNDLKKLINFFIG